MKKSNLLKPMLIGVTLLNFFVVSGQEKPKNNKYLKDFDYFIKSLIEIHPDPYSAFGDQIEFHRAKTKCRNEIKKVDNNYDFAIKLNQFISILEDGHTFIELTKKSDSGDTKKLPLKLKAASDFLFIQNTTKEHKGLIGKAIVAINDVPIQKLLEKAKQLRSSENLSGAYHNLINILKTNHSIKPLLGDCQSLNFSFKNEQKKIVIPFEPEVDFLVAKSSILGHKNNGLLYWQMVGKKKNVGYLAWNGVISREYIEWVYANQQNRLKSQLSWAYNFMTPKRTWDNEEDIAQIPSLYKEFYELLKEMEKSGSANLIIDLRNNRGGMTPLIEPLLYLLHGDKYLSFDFKVEYIKKYSLQYIKKIGFESVDDLNKAWYGDFKVGDYNFEKFGNYKSYLPVEERRKSIGNGYQGFGAEYVIKASQYKELKPNIIVLSSPNTFSAAFHFMYFLKKLGNTTILGVASRQAGNSFMETTNFQLAETKLTGSISNAKQILFKNEPELGKILKPDVEMRWEDFQKYNFDKNAELLKALEFVENTK